MKARLTTYAGWQLRDYFVGRGLETMLATGAAVWAYAATHGLTLSVFDSAGGIDARNQLQQAFEFALEAFAFIAAAVAAQGLVARYRSRGYDRVFFSRPLAPARYYTQGFVVSGFGALVLAIAGSEVYSVAVHPVSLPGVVAYVALAWLTVGGFAFVLSSLTRFHTLVVALAVGADLALNRYAVGLRADGGGNAVLEAVQYLLPPAHVVGALREPFARGILVEPRVLAWPLSFGLACLIVAMLLLRSRPFRS
jgi:hypothetical protein